MILYLTKDAWNKDDFDICDVYKEENERLDGDSEIYGYEIDDFHYTCAVPKDIKERYKYETDAVMDDLWMNGVLIDKASNQKICDQYPRGLDATTIEDQEDFF